MKIWAYLALATLLIGTATGALAWVYAKGKADQRAEYDRAALVASRGALVQADRQGRVDAGIAFAATADVHTITTTTAARRDKIARADLTPVRPATTGGSDALVCPDVLSGRFVRLWNGHDDPDPTAAPAGAATGVPAGR